jgi:aubergine-like protein
MKDYIDEQENQPNKPQTQIITYAKAPPKNNLLRKDDSIISLTSNLMKLTLKDPLQKVYIYSIEIMPELAKDNYTLQKKIYKLIEQKLSPYFNKFTFAGLNLFGSTRDPKDEIIIEENVEKTDYKITFKKVGALNFSEITTKQGMDQKKKNFIEKLIKDILLSSKDRVRFGTDRMVLSMDKDNVMRGNDGSTIYKGFFTSAQITENGLYLLVLNMNKYTSGKTMYEKIYQIMEEGRHHNRSQDEIKQKIEDYIDEHRTVLTIYGSIRAYRIESIDFEKNPMNTSFNIKTQEGMKTVTIYNYYQQQYKQNIKHKDQPLLIAERKVKDKKLLKSEEDKNKNEDLIYLVPELVLITGIENEAGSKSRRQDIISKTKTNPNQRMNEINKIHDLMNDDTPKQFKKNGELISTKSSKQLADEWGINLGENLSLEGRVLNQPKLIFNNKRLVTPKNGLFRTESAYDGVTITRDNFMYIYNRKDRADFRSIINNLFNKAKIKDIRINVRPDELYSYGFNRAYNWEDIKHELKKINFNPKLRMVMVFLDNNLEHYYNQLKEYLTNVIKVNSQFSQTRRLTDPKRAGSIMFNIVEQINIKMGGINFYIDTSNLINDKVYLIIGLESKKVGKDSIDYVLTFAYNQRLSRTQTIPRTCKNNAEEISKTLNELLDEAIKGLHFLGHAPHPPEYIIIYRQGGNHLQNVKTSQLEIPIFLGNINQRKEKIESFRRHNTKLIYICCNLKGDLKFFEESKNGYSNPPSGLCIDERIVESGKYEFYLQPQYVNQGTATPCHYEVLYQDIDEKNPENNMSIEELENLSFQLSFYYWTWSGAVRVPGVLRLSTTAIDYYSRCLNHRLDLDGHKFTTPGFI